MGIDKNQILKNHCYTELVYERINKKLKTTFSNSKIEEFIQKVIQETKENHFKKIGKNFYVSNKEYNIKITINSNTFRVITVDKLIK